MAESTGRTLMVRDGEALARLREVRDGQGEFVARMAKLQERHMAEASVLHERQSGEAQELLDGQNARMEGLFKRLAEALGLEDEDPYRWRIDTQYLDRHGVAFLIEHPSAPSPLDGTAGPHTLH